MKEYSNPITFGFPISLRYDTQPIKKERTLKKKKKSTNLKKLISFIHSDFIYINVL